MSVFRLTAVAVAAAASVALAPVPASAQVSAEACAVDEMGVKVHTPPTDVEACVSDEVPNIGEWSCGPGMFSDVFCLVIAILRP